MQWTHAASRSGSSNKGNFNPAAITSADAANASRCHCLLHDCKYRHITKSVLWLYQYAGPMACFTVTHTYRYPTLIMYDEHSTTVPPVNTKHINVTITLHAALYSCRICVAGEGLVGAFRNCCYVLRPVCEPQACSRAPKSPPCPFRLNVLRCCTDACTQRNYVPSVTPSLTTCQLRKFEVNGTNVSALLIIEYLLDDYVSG